MILKLDLERLQTPGEFMAGNTLVDFQLTSRDAYDGVRRLLVRLHYLNLSRPDKGFAPLWPKSPGYRGRRSD